MATHESSANESSNTCQPVKTTPKDALVMAAILKELGVTEYEPRIINQMIEFAYRYVTDIVEDARVYSLHASRKTINLEDIKLAVSQKLDHSFTSPPPREFLLEIARTKNSQPLPLISDRSGLRLPPERYCLTSSNYRVKTVKKAPPRLKTTNVATKGTMKISSLSSSLNSQHLTYPQQGLNSQNDGVQQSNQGNTSITFPTTLKRKHEDEEDYDI
ncbi:transcription initiation factor TFIID subunit 9B isoform X2 [Hydra vulgaris]|uniref:Transcription initiation factor TFIID subunit 9B isoform X2 n=1 Tax=Hydra vulgaris TaxID=6087 RepID=A0ABM4B532_HYDVU